MRRRFVPWAVCRTTWNGAALARRSLAISVGFLAVATLFGHTEAKARVSFPLLWADPEPAVKTPPARRHRHRHERRQRHTKHERETLPAEITGPLQIVVSIADQHVTLYADGKSVARGKVSTGTSSHPTPTGVFTVIQKDRYHHSNVYSNAPMPFMQRITWSGVALHQGPLPGRPASHGCIRLTGEFAQLLWKATKLGVRVIVARNDVAPADIDSAKLFSAKPPVPNPVLAQKPAGPGIKTASVAVNDATPHVPEKPKAFGPPLTAKPGRITVLISRETGRLYVRRNFVPLFESPVVIREPARPFGTHVFTALDVAADGKTRWNVMSVPTLHKVHHVKRTKHMSRAERRRLDKLEAEPPQPAEVPSAAEVLDRIDIPSDVADKISRMMAPGASLIVSDLPASRDETGLDTDFIVLTK